MNWWLLFALTGACFEVVQRLPRHRWRTPARAWAPKEQPVAQPLYEQTAAEQSNTGDHDVGLRIPYHLRDRCKLDFVLCVRSWKIIARPAVLKADEKGKGKADDF